MNERETRIPEDAPSVSVRGCNGHPLPGATVEIPGIGPVPRILKVTSAAGECEVVYRDGIWSGPPPS